MAYDNELGIHIRSRAVFAQKENPHSIFAVRGDVVTMLNSVLWASCAMMTVVKNKDIAKSYRAMFKCIWDASPSLGRDEIPLHK
ncbi:MAG: hypothetical protein Q7S52_03110 [bacterium]|nr:hypothetical protein [bacterium]